MVGREKLALGVPACSDSSCLSIFLRVALRAQSQESDDPAVRACLSTRVRFAEWGDRKARASAGAGHQSPLTSGGWSVDSS